MSDPDFSARQDCCSLTNDMFVERWSPRAFSDESIGDEVLESIFDAARFAPSSFNLQPWRFVTARRGSERFDDFVSLLLPTNRVFAEHAPVLGFVLADHQGPEGNRNASAVFDTGLAYMSLILQAHLHNVFGHAMGGIDREGVLRHFDLDESRYVACCGFVLAKIGDPRSLPEHLRSREVPSPRVSLPAIWSEDSIPDSWQ